MDFSFYKIIILINNNQVQESNVVKFEERMKSKQNKYEIVSKIRSQKCNSPTVYVFYCNCKCNSNCLDVEKDMVGGHCKLVLGTKESCVISSSIVKFLNTFGYIS